MQLVHPLMSGFADCPSGTAYIYGRGTTTNATVYSDFEATTAITAAPAAGYTLDSAGRVEVYVNAYVDVLVKTAGGSTKANFTCGNQAQALEVKHAHITGNAYSGGSALGNPNTLNQVLDLMYTSFGGNDFKVPISGTDTLLKNAVGGVLGLFFNVKDPTYGAIGNGSTDDKVAIQAAITAASLAGGTVVFPAGTYRISNVLSVPGNVSLWGVGGATAATLAIDHATANTIDITTYAVKGLPVIDGLNFLPLQANTGDLIREVDGSVPILVRNCFFGDNSRARGNAIHFDTNSTDSVIENCAFLLAPFAGSRPIFSDDTASNGTYLVVRGCVFSAPAGAYSPTTAMVRAAGVKMSDCLFSMSAMTSGTVLCVSGHGQSGSSITGTDFINPVGGAVTAMSPGLTNAGFGIGANDYFHESGNSFGTTIVTYFNMSAGHVTQGGRGYTTDSAASATYDPNFRDFSVLALSHTRNGTVTITPTPGGLPQAAAIGAEWTLIATNNSGFSQTLAFSSAFKSDTPFTYASADRITIRFFNDGSKWVQISAEANYTP